MIKKINNKFIEKIIRLHKISIFPLWDEQGRKYSIKGVKKFVIDIFDKGEVFGYFLEKKFVGVIGFTIKKNIAEVDFLLVDPNFQKKGIGKKLMKFVERKVKDKVSKIILQVLIKNKAVKFYKKLDYKISFKKKKKYQMEKRILK